MYTWCAEYALEVPMSREHIWFLHQYSACSAAFYRRSSLNTLIEGEKETGWVHLLFYYHDLSVKKETFFFSFSWSELHACFQAESAKD
jgi:hypothetical protein